MSDLIYWYCRKKKGNSILKSSVILFAIKKPEHKIWALPKEEYETNPDTL